MRDPTSEVSMNIVSILAEHARIRPHAVAIVDARYSALLSARRRPAARSALTFADLETASAGVAALFWRAGLRPGDVALVFQPMSADLYVVLLALFRLGAVAMFVDPSAGRERLALCCATMPPKALVAIPKAHLLRLTVPSLARVPLKFSTGMWIPGATSLRTACELEPRARLETVSSDAPALVTFTSGSTGEPKAAVRTHGFLLAQHEALAQTLGLEPGLVDLPTLPIFVLANLASGVTSVLPDADVRHPGAIDPEPVVAQVRAFDVASTAASPALLERVARHCRAKGVTLPSLRKVFAGGAPVFPVLVDELAAVAPNADIVTVYGSTEAEPIAEVSRGDTSAEDVERTGRGAGLLAGKPVDSVRLCVVRDRWGRPVGPYDADAFAAERLPPGEVGEIVVSGRHVLPGYLGGRGDEETKFRVEGDVWHRTGDLGYLDDGGRLWLMGRCGARVADARGTLYPFAVEAAARRRAGVRRAALAALNGRRVLAVELEEGSDGAAIDALRHELAWACLDEVRVCKAIPVDARHNAKVDYPALYRMLGGA
jgi:acyl-CoA synthetase (AMP-forming)/AMP-acid ligase II